MKNQHHMEAWGIAAYRTGVYLASQSLRYAVTNDPIAKQNIIRTVHALHHFLKVTGKKGFIARYWYNLPSKHSDI